MDLQDLIDARLASADAHLDTAPLAIIVVGPIAAGKTRYRQTQLNRGFVNIDSADIFHQLSAGDARLDFPDAFADEIEIVGRALTEAALEQKKNIALETPGADADELIKLVDALKSVGYTVEIEAIATDWETCELQNASRGDNVSSYYAAPIHCGWVIDECTRRTAAPTPSAKVKTSFGWFGGLWKYRSNTTIH